MAKGGKGRKGGGGGGGKTRKYSRDNNGRFASTGTGATARGGRLLTPKGNKRKTQTIEAGGAKAAGTIKGKVKRDPAAASKVAQRKAAAKPTAAKRSAQAESDRGSAADRKERAKLLSAMPKEGRRAVQTAKTASRQRQAKGQLGVGIEGRRGRNTDQSINSVNEGSTRLRFDAGKRKSDPTKLTEGLRASTARSMAGSANSLKARMKTTAASKRTKAFGGTTTRRQLPGVKGTIKKQTKPPAAKPPAAKLPRAQRLERATATANRIAKDRSAKSDAATAALMARKGISRRSSSKGRSAAFEKEDAAGKVSAAAQRKWLGAEKRAENLRKTKGSETTAAKPPAAKAPKAKGRIRATKREPLAPNSQLANKIGSLKGDREVFKGRLKVQQEIAKKTTSRTGKLSAQTTANEIKQNIAGRTRSITKLEARPIAGKRVTGRGDGPVTGPRAKRPNAIRGKVKRDTNLKQGPTTNAQRYPNIYRDSANTKGKAAAKAEKAAAKPPTKSKRTPDEAKVKRMAERFQAKGAAPASDSLVKRLNSTEARQRAIKFLAKPNSAGSNAPAAVAQNIGARRKYSTGTPNRNKPGPYNSLEQGRTRAKAKIAAQTAREKIEISNTQKAAKEQQRKNATNRGALSRRDLTPYKAGKRAPGYVKGKSAAGTMKKPAPKPKAPNPLVARTRSQAIAAQRTRTGLALERTGRGRYSNFDTGTHNDGKRPKGLKRSDTGMRQLSLMGTAKTLYSYKTQKAKKRK